ncbi:MAG: serine hydrolase domain-containing protein [Vicinamibacterales bacterium]
MLKTRTETWLALIVGAIALFLLGLGGLWVVMSATPPLHPNAQDVTVVAGEEQPQWAGAAARAREIVRASVAEQNLPGASVAVGAGGSIVWAEGFGWADIEQRTPVTPHTRFRIGTASVALTSAAAGLLIEKGQLKLDERIQAYVPEFPQKEWPVTVRQLMGHVAGVPTDGGDEGPLFAERCERAVEALPHFAGRSLRFEPGTEFRYSSYGWILVSAAIEAAANEPLLAFMRQHVFEPLGMTATRADAGSVPIADVTSFYFPRFAADPRYGPDPMRPLEYSCYAGASVFLSTPSDLVRFAVGINSGKLLQPATVELLQASQRLASGQETGYGLGWDLETAEIAGRPTPVIGHDGESLGGVVSSFMTFPEHGITVAVTSNTSYADTYTVAVKIAEAFAEATPRRR